MVTSILVTVAIAACFDGTLAAIGWNAPRAPHWPAFAPPPGAIGAVWVVLFALLGAAYELSRRAARAGRPADARGVIALIAVCLAYPPATHLVPGHLTELVGNAVALTVSVLLAMNLRRSAPIAAACVSVVAVWIVFATALVIGLIQLNGWST